MKRMHVHVSVENLEDSIRFHSAMFGNAELAEINERFAAAELPVHQQSATTSCYAKSDKAWAIDPQGVACETFRTLEAAPVYGMSHDEAVVSSACCAPGQATIYFW